MIPHSHLAHRKCDLFHIRWAQIMVSSQADSGAGRALLTAIVTWISASFELPGSESYRSPTADRVLVIDDDATARELIADHLKAEGFSVATAAGGVEGLKLAKDLRPTAITLDVLMPDLDGWSVLAALRKDP